MDNIINTESHIKGTARDIFLHLLSMIMLIVSIIGLLVLVFGCLNALFPDQLDFCLGCYLDQMRLSTSILVVVFPVYILISWILGRDYRKEPGKRDIKARRVFMYLTLFAAAITVIVDLVTLIYRFYSGDYSVQFFLKIISVLIVAVAVFGYYLWDIRRTNYESKKPKLCGWLSSGVIATVVILGFLIVGSPATQRDRRFDEQRVNDLQNIQNAIAYNYYAAKHALPPDLNALRNEISGITPPNDPQTGQPYEYKIVNQSGLQFQICANFVTESIDEKYQSSGPFIGVPGGGADNWKHGIGRTCFLRTIDSSYFKGITPSLITP